ncbi:MAG: hypothetical protein V4636_05345 [Pseudomonadota bacterium]
MNSTIPPEVAAVLAEIFTDKDRAKLAEWEDSGTECMDDPDWNWAAARKECAEKIESALTKAEAVEPVAEVSDSFIFFLRKQPDGTRWPVGTKLYAHATPAVQVELLSGDCVNCDGTGRQGGDGSPDPCTYCDATGVMPVPTESLGRDAQDPMNWAQGLIAQLPADHDGRNSWLLNHGYGDEPKWLRAEWARYTDECREYYSGSMEGPKPERRRYPVSPAEPPASVPDGWLAKKLADHPDIDEGAMAGPTFVPDARYPSCNGCGATWFENGKCRKCGTPLNPPANQEGAAP